MGLSLTLSQIRGTFAPGIPTRCTSPKPQDHHSHLCLHSCSTLRHNYAPKQKHGVSAVVQTQSDFP